jgi:hypothetical protein
MRLWLLAGISAMPLAQPAFSQDDPNNVPLGDVARNMRKKPAPGQDVIDNDNLPKVMQQAESHHTLGSALKFLMAGDTKNFRVATPDVTCSLSFSANAKSLLSGQYSQMDLPPAELRKLEGPATIEGDALTVSVFNGTDWHVSEVAVALTIVRKPTHNDASLAYGTAKLVPAAATSEQESDVHPDDVRPEKKPDVTVIYRMRAGAPPSGTTVFSAPLSLELAPGEEWHWALVQAKGYPPPGYLPVGTHTAATVNNAPSSRAILPPGYLLDDSPAASPQDPK